MTRINSNGAFKPDFLVYSIAKGTKCVILVAKFKPTTEQDSYVELDLAMKSRMNKYITNSVAQPKTCRIHCEGEDLQTYVMDLSCAKLYRMTNLSKIKLFKHTNQISLMPNVLTHLVCLKAVTQETAVKAEAVTLYSCKHLKRHASNPPTEWLDRKCCALPDAKEAKQVIKPALLSILTLNKSFIIKRAT